MMLAGLSRLVMYRLANISFEVEISPEQKRKKHRLIIIGVIVLLLLIVAFVICYIVALQGRITTDDAYTDGHAIPISAKVSGYVQELTVTDNDLVKAGDLLVAIDSRDYQDALRGAEATLASDQALIASR